ncbi:MAG: tyrosine-type recombinase/integrase, partial [Planctomycetaceae bacterium]|nr:tyrosine-type recombinase/integrase [Planctomycetaceae bacterium]
MPLLEFIERPEFQKSFSLPSRVTSDFAQQFVRYLRGRNVTRNGKSGGKTHPMSRKHQENCFTTIRTLFNWGRKPEQSLLPAAMMNPFMPELLGAKTTKDPLRENKIPLNIRIALVEQMDRQELLNLSFPLVLPIRPDELCAAFVEDLDLSQEFWRIETKGDDWYFTKGRTSFTLPLPPVLVRIGQILVREHRFGPLFRVFGPTSSKAPHDSAADDGPSFGKSLLTKLNEDDVKRSLPPQDRKAAFLQAMAAAGGLSTDYLRKQWRRLFRLVNLPDSVRPYDLRGAVSTDMHQAGIRHLELRYLTGHTSNDIMNE